MIGLNRIAPALRSGTGIVVGTLITLNMIRLISTLVLTRFLAPEDYGILGLITVTHFAIVMLSDLGIDSYIIRSRAERDKNMLNVIWTIKATRLLLIALIVIIAAWPLAHFFGNPQIAPAIAFSALSFVFLAPQSLSMPLAVRQQKIMVVSIIDIGLALVTFILSIALAMYRPDYWAILIPLVLSGALKTLLSYICFADSSHRFRYDENVAKDLWNFARYAFRSSLISLAITQMDKLAFGRLMSLEQFGLYMLAVNLASIPKMFVDSYGPRVLLPAYAAGWRETPDAMRDVFHKQIRFIGPVYCFLVGGLLSFAPVIVALMYEDRYAGAAYYLACLSIPALFAVTAIAATECLIAVGEIRATYFANLGRLFILLPATLMAFWMKNVDIILVALAVAEFSASILMCTWLYRKGMFHIRYILPAPFAALAGIGLGWCAYKLATMLWDIKPSGLLT
jgi:lipopolysaccharide exporter